jgi:hypothetical protein
LFDKLDLVAKIITANSATAIRSFEEIARAISTPAEANKFRLIAKKNKTRKRPGRKSSEPIIPRPISGVGERAHKMMGSLWLLCFEP